MTWRYVLAAVVGVALLGSALALATHEPPGVEGPYLRREVTACVCREVR